MPAEPAHDPVGPERRFVTTRWSVVLAAGGEEGDPTVALEELCRTYWFPVYAYFRRRGNSPAEAEDLTQGFFLRLIDRQSLVGIRREGGRFRSFLLTSAEHFLANDADRRNAQKRGGGRVLLSLHAEDAEGRYVLDAPDADTPETVFEKRWAFALLERVADRLNREFARAGKGALFEALRGYLPGDQSGPAYAETATRLGMSEGGVKVAVHRLRQRYGALLREAVADTVGDPAETDAELQHLIGIVGR